MGGRHGARSSVSAPTTPRPTASGRFDIGPRCLAVVNGGRARLLSRQQRSLTRAVPEIVQALGQQFRGHVVLDGELVCWDEGRVDFTALQRRLRSSWARAQRLAAVMPAAYVVFDVLAPTWSRRDFRATTPGECRCRECGWASADASHDVTLERREPPGSSREARIHPRRSTVPVSKR
jgi:hypothetical protein